MAVFIRFLTVDGMFLCAFLALSVYVPLCRPRWFERLSKLFGCREGYYGSPFYFYKRWTWSEVPSNWRSILGQCVFWMVAFGALAIFLVFMAPALWPFIAVYMLMSVHFAAFAVRIYIKVKSMEQNKANDR